MGFSDWFSEEKKIEGLPISKFYAEIYLLSVTYHYTNMNEFLNSIALRNSSDNSSKWFSPGMSSISVENSIEQIFIFYYFLFNQYVFPKVKDNVGFNDYSLFKKNFSNKVNKEINSEPCFKDFLWEDSSSSDYSHDMIEEDKLSPQFYKDISEYYKTDKGIMINPAITIMSERVKSSDIVTHLRPNKVIENGIIYFFSMMCINLKCLPYTPDFYYERDREQVNSDLFNECFRLLVDDTYRHLGVIEAAGNQALII